MEENSPKALGLLPHDQEATWQKNEVEEHDPHECIAVKIWVGRTPIGMRVEETEPNPPLGAAIQSTPRACMSDVAAYPCCLNGRSICTAACKEGNCAQSGQVAAALMVTPCTTAPI